jgi:glycosyltransferase involved in cell wall biosynthesis
MRIGVNLLPLKPAQIGGLEACTKRLLEHLMQVDRRNEYVLFVGEWNAGSMTFRNGRYRMRLVGAAGREQDLYVQIKSGDIDLWFCPLIYLEPRHLPIPSVVLVPDIQHEYHPQFFTRAELKARALIYRPSCEDATEVLTISNFSRASIVERYGVAADKVHCVYLAPIWRFSPPGDGPGLDDVKGKYGLDEDYAVYPANMWPHKNHEMLLLGLYRLARRHGLRPAVALLGQDMGRGARIKELIEHLGLAGQIYLLSYVDDSDVPSLIQGARCLVFPSLYEGFGLPLIEAMAAGCPVACADAASIPEVVGDAGLLFDPRSPDAIAEAIRRVWTDDALRSDLAERGRTRVRGFSWTRAARETLHIFDVARRNFGRQG